MPITTDAERIIIMKKKEPNGIGRSSAAGLNIVTEGLPQALVAAVEGSGFKRGDFLFAVRGDLHLSGDPAEVWLVVGQESCLCAVPATESTPARRISGPFAWSAMKKSRVFQTVGSSFLQFLMDGVYINVIRFSNARREFFGRAQGEIERLIDGKKIRLEPLSAPSETVCSVCQLPLPGLRASCPRCAGRRGIFMRTLQLMQPYSWSIFLLLLMMIAGVCFDLIPPQLTRYMVDRVLETGAVTAVVDGVHGDITSTTGVALDAVVHSPATLSYRERLLLLAMILLGLVMSSAFRQILNIFIGRTSSIIGTRITKELRERLQEKLVGLSVEYYNRHSAGSLMSRVMYDVDYFQGFVVQVAQGFLLNLLLVLGIGTMLFVMNWKLALLVMLPIPFVVVGTTFFWKHIYPRYYRLWDSQSKMAQLLTGLLQGIRLVKVFGQEEREQARFSKAAGYMQDARRSVETSVATFNPLMGFVFGLGGLIIWFAGGKLVLQQHISLGTLMAFFGYMGIFYGPCE